MEESRSSDFRLGEWVVSPPNGEIRGANGGIHLEPRAMAVLSVLAEKPGETISREELLHRVWDGVVVNEEALTRTVHDLRHHFHDDRRNPRYIQTVAKRGYRLVAPVTPLPEKSVKSSAPASRHGRPLPLKWLLALLAVLLALAVLAYLLHAFAPEKRAGATNQEPPSVAVLPFRNFSQDSEFSYFGDGVAEELLHQLARRPGLRVVARTSAFAFRGSKAEIPQIARELGVDAVVEGSIRQSGGRLRITAQLVDARGYHLWSDQIDTEVGDLLKVQTRIADRITRALAPHLNPPRVALPGESPGHINKAALAKYLRGRRLLDNRDRQSLQKAIDLFRGALRDDPHFVRALANEAMAWWFLNYYANEPVEDARRMAETAARQVLGVDTSVAEAHMVLAWVAVVDHDWRTAEKELITASQIEPSNALVENLRAGLAYKLGRREQCLEHELRARQLDPLSSEILADLAFMYFSYDMIPEFHDAAKAAEQAGAESQAYYDKYLAVRERRWKDARRLWDGALERAGVDPDFMQAALAVAAGEGDRGAALRMIRAAEDNPVTPAWYLLVSYAYARSDTDMARLFRRLERQSDYTYLRFWWPEFTHFRRMPVFAAFAEEAGLADYWDNFDGPVQCRRQSVGWICQ
ncbi:MAG: winged helix-turn-helix domain-containing protein [Gammaproteobacteria bacterium]|jgi:TolB-like protein/DNA-binding winged helix-turn-helix (wHTH) protein/tetratricopeptide (TPR) repeat protein